MKHLIKLKDAAPQLQVTVATLRGWRLRRAHLEFVKVGGRLCVTQESVEQFVLLNMLPPIVGGKAVGDKKNAGQIR